MNSIHFKSWFNCSCPKVNFSPSQWIDKALEIRAFCRENPQITAFSVMAVTNLLISTRFTVIGIAAGILIEAAAGSYIDKALSAIEVRVDEAMKSLEESSDTEAGQTAENPAPSQRKIRIFNLCLTIVGFAAAMLAPSYPESVIRPLPVLGGLAIGGTLYRWYRQFSIVPTTERAVIN